MSWIDDKYAEACEQRAELRESPLYELPSLTRYANAIRSLEQPVTPKYDLWEGKDGKLYTGPYDPEREV